jgi:hypothetical protein
VLRKKSPVAAGRFPHLLPGAWYQLVVQNKKKREYDSLVGLTNKDIGLDHWS